MRIQPDGYLLEMGRDGEDKPIATMACRDQAAATELAESICANMRKAYWWSVTPIIFGTALEVCDVCHRNPHEPKCPNSIEFAGHCHEREKMPTPKSPPSDLVAPANSPEQNGSQPAPMIKIDPETGQRKSTPTQGPETGVCLNCGARMAAPHMCTDGETFHRVAWCGECGAFHAQGTPDDGDGWSYTTPEAGDDVAFALIAELREKLRIERAGRPGWK